MSAAIHYENANFLRELAESLPRIRPQGHSQGQADLLQRLADDELTQAQHDEWVRTKVAASSADKRPGMSTEQLRKLLHTRYEALRNAP
jgi:hypothetical protein